MRVLTIILLNILSLAVYGQVGILTDTPHASSALEIYSTNKGLLIPRLSLTSNLNSPSPVSSPATGLLIFNSGANQALGFYYWNGSKWVSTSYSTNNWSITGNSGTSVSNNFLGTTDNQHLAIKTNNTERMRFESDGQIIIGATTPNATEDLFTVQANATQNYAINAYSPSGYGVYSSAGIISFYGAVNNDNGFPLWVSNQGANGYGAMLIGSNSGAYTLQNHTAALSANGNDGIFSLGQASDGMGIIAGGNNVATLSTISVGAGGAFTGYHGIYGKGVNSSSGVGVIGVGNNGSTYSTNPDGSGGAFTGYHGVFANSTDLIYGTGCIGVGNAGIYYLFDDGNGHQGSGGAFTGKYVGVAAWASQANNSSIGVYGRYNGNGSYDGTGVYGIAITSNSNRGYGVYGEGNRYGIYANGDMGASGSKSFAIDHPLDPENKILKHYSIESPEVLNMYRGNIILDQKGEAVVRLPDYFNEININFSYQLTAVGMAAPGIFVKNEINEKGEFKIAGGNAGQKISWTVFADRNDPYMKTNRDKEVDVLEKPDYEKGKYITPKLYGQPESKGIFFRAADGLLKKPVLHKARGVKVTLSKNIDER
ncbi:MAG: hypothetical protein GXO88_10485 [Chlorobi bacterium]|nr:hypothetical protein [Chlorobiota bacterium]